MSVFNALISKTGKDTEGISNSEDLDQQSDRGVHFLPTLICSKIYESLCTSLFNEPCWNLTEIVKPVCLAIVMETNSDFIQCPNVFQNPYLYRNRTNFTSEPTT